jgi:hypothetical protein
MLWVRILIPWQQAAGPVPEHYHELKIPKSESDGGVEKQLDDSKLHGIIGVRLGLDKIILVDVRSNANLSVAKLA